MRPRTNNSDHFRPKLGEENGTYVYQLMLNSMQVLPVANVSQITLFENKIQDTGLSSPGKKQKRQEPDISLQSKKKHESAQKNVTAT
jgi:hypothetical protein